MISSTFRKCRILVAPINCPLATFSAAEDKNCTFYLLFSAGIFLGAYVSRLNWGSYNNVVIPAYAALAILFGLAVDYMITMVSNNTPLNQKLGRTFIYFI
ncbi:hypothetical protein ACFL27_05895, partial [candidate division CSSED10-310 bacterium]